MVLLTKENMDPDKLVTVVNLPPVQFIGAPTRQVRKGSIQESWDPEMSVSMITMVGVTAEEALNDIGTNSRNVVINMECDGEAS